MKPQCVPPPRRRLRFTPAGYVTWRLRRALFWGFGATILATGLLVRTTLRWFEARGQHPPFLVFFIILVALWGASGILARRLTRPLAALLRAAEAFGRGDLSTRVSAGHTRHGEARVIAATFNQMADRIERQVADQRALLATVSHEIRSPLARIRLHTELGREAEDPSPSLSAIDDEVAIVDRLVGDLLAGARIDFGSLARKEVAPHALAVAALEALGDRVSPDVLQVDEGLPLLSVDEGLVVRAIANLLHNACKHAGGVVAFRVRETSAFVVFEVTDEGPGVRAEDRDHVFEPFFYSAVRDVSSASGNSGEATSVGLGLALVRRIALAHGGTASVAPAPNGQGATFRLEIPYQTSA